MKTRHKPPHVSRKPEPRRPFGGNADLHIRPKPDPLFAAPPFIDEIVLFSRVGHTFGPAPSLFPGAPAAYMVQDFLLDQTGASGGDGKMKSTKVFDLTTATRYRFGIFPKNSARRIKVARPNPGPVFIGLDAGRKFVSAMSDVADAYTAESRFVDLAGISPTFSYNSFFIGRNTNHWVQFVVQAEVMDSITFSGFTTIGLYPARSFDPGPKAYNPFSSSHPFNLPGPNTVPYLVFSYRTTNPNDPGPFVFLG